MLSGRFLGQLQLIVAVVDPVKRDEKNKPVTYTAALVELFRWRNGGQVHNTHGMFEVEKWPASSSSRPRNLGPLRFYETQSVINCAHLVPADVLGTRFYVNNWASWEAYNTIYNPDFLESNRQAVARLARQFK